ncbi:hypothetical protein [Caulifigura coniformis]|nr:hypothetical protein [Caulifigura coniformis]
MNLHHLDQAPATMLTRLETQMRVTDVRFSSDDRGDRQLVFHDGDDIELVPVNFRYTSLHFDIAGIGNELTVCVNARNSNGLMDQMTGEGVGPFVFRAQTSHLLRNDALLVEDRWQINPFPQPLVFEPTDRTGKPQPHVAIVN